jgi:hypothetical protein
MTTISQSALFNPEVLARAVSGGFANIPVLYGSGAVIVDTAMPYGNDYLGASVKIPYFTLPNEWTVLSDGSALTPAAIAVGNAAGNSTTPESETVLRAGIAFDFTTWAKSNPLDPYGEARRQMLLGFAQAMEKQLITNALRNTASEWDNFTLDITANTDNLLNHDAIVDGATLLGSEGFNDPFILGIVHSHTIASMWKRKDATGKPWLVARPGEMTAEGAQIYRLEPLGIPLLVSDRMTVSGSTYSSAFFRRGAMSLWINPNLSARSVQSPTTDSQIDGLNCYFTSHRYVRLSNRAKPGVVIIKHK